MRAVLIFILMSAAGWMAQANSIRNYTQITVVAFDEKLHLFIVQMDNEPAVGPNYVTAENLKKGIGFPGTVEHFLEKKDQVVNTKYTLQNELPLVSEDDLPRIPLPSGKKTKK